MQMTQQNTVGTTVQNQTSFMNKYRRIKYRNIFFIMCSFLVVFLSAGPIFAESDDALFIDESGNVAIGKNLNVNENIDVSGTLKAKKLEGDGSALTFEGIEGNPPLSLEEVIRAMIADMIPIGTIMAYGGDVTNPDIKGRLKAQGWLFCDGSRIDKNGDYKDLYAVIKDAFGSDGNNFYLPDMRGRFLRGVSHGTHNDPDATDRKHSQVGGNKGNKVGTLQADKVGSHRHMVYSDGCKEGDVEWGFSKAGKGGSKPGSINSRYTAKIGENIGIETRPKNIYVNWIIKAKHIIRSRQ